MSTNRFRIALLLAVVAAIFPAMAQQRPPFIGPQPPDPGPNRLEVRFAMGKQPVTCKRFELTGQSTVLINDNLGDPNEDPENFGNR